MATAATACPCPPRTEGPAGHGQPIGMAALRGAPLPNLSWWHCSSRPIPLLHGRWGNPSFRQQLARSQAPGIVLSTSPRVSHNGSA